AHVRRAFSGKAGGGFAGRRGRRLARAAVHPTMNPLIAHFRMMARYNRLANERLYDCCAQLSDAERKQNRQAFFKSIHATLNHIMVGDRNWMNRFEGGVPSSAPLDTVLYDDFEALRAARVREDERIERF